MAKKLTAKQKAFVSEYLVDLNATAAAIRAGYSEKSARKVGSDTLAKPHVQAAIEEALAERRERVEVTQDQVIADLLEIKERCLQRSPVVDRRGDQIQDDEGRDVWSFNAKDAIRALELLGKHLGMFVERSKMDVEVGLEVHVSYGDEKGND
ncbi:MAG: terminase small subunit [Synergistales bacterium]|nr:terminase small subunit [Synergistales bacterium]